jgi:hypothetical protein
MQLNSLLEKFKELLFYIRRRWSVICPREIEIPVTAHLALAILRN